MNHLRTTWANINVPLIKFVRSLSWLDSTVFWGWITLDNEIRNNEKHKTIANKLFIATNNFWLIKRYYEPFLWKIQTQQIFWLNTQKQNLGTNKITASLYPSKNYLNCLKLVVRFPFISQKCSAFSCKYRSLYLIPISCTGK